MKKAQLFNADGTLFGEYNVDNRTMTIVVKESYSVFREVTPGLFYPVEREMVGRPKPPKVLPLSTSVHDLVKTGDPDVFPAILDRNHEVCLSYCRRCNKGEGELGDTCTSTVQT